MDKLIEHSPIPTFVGGQLSLTKFAYLHGWSGRYHYPCYRNTCTSCTSYARQCLEHCLSRRICPHQASPPIPTFPLNGEGATDPKHGMKSQAFAIQGKGHLSPGERARCPQPRPQQSRQSPLPWRERVRVRGD
jgi:hypothetical protein